MILPYDAALGEEEEEAAQREYYYPLSNLQKDGGGQCPLAEDLDC